MIIKKISPKIIKNENDKKSEYQSDFEDFN